MPDFDNSIALKVQVPNVMNTLGNIASTAGAMQQVKQGQMDLEERKALRELSHKMDQYQGPDGSLDLNRLVNDASQTAPKLGMEWAKQIAAAHVEGIGVRKSLTDLSEQQRGVIGQLVLSVADKPYDQQEKIIGAAVNANPQLKMWGDVALKHLNSVADDPEAAKHVAMQIAKATTSVPTQNQLNTGAYLNTGGSNVNVNQMASGAQQQIPNTLPPTTQTVNPNTLQPEYVGATAGGSRVAAGAAPGQLQNIADLQKEVSSIRQAGDQVPIQRNINQSIIRLSRDTTTGPGSKFWQQGLAAAGLGQFGDNYQELGKFLEKNAIQNMQAMGGQPSDARLSAASAANGSTEFNPGALQTVTKFNDATTSAVDKYRQGIDKAVGVENPNFGSAAKFKSEWSKNLDIDVFRVENAIRDGDTMELQKITHELGPDKLKKLAEKRKNLESLANTGKLP